MSVVFRAAASVLNSTTAVNITVARPTGTLDGDYLVAFIARAAGAAPTPPAGWTTLGTAAINGTAVTLAAFGKLASSEPSTWTWTATTAISWGQVLAYSGVDPLNPVNTSNTNLLGAVSLFFAHSATVLAGGVVIGAWAATRAATGLATTWTPGSNPLLTNTERLDTSSNNGAGTDITGEVVEVTSPSADVLQTIFGTTSQIQAAGAAWMVALRPYFPLPAVGTVVPVMVEAAMGADLTADPTTWVWTDLSSRLKGGDEVTIVRGQTDETQQTQPSTGTLTLDNTDGWLTPRNPGSPWYLLWGEDTPVRFSQQYPLGPYVRLQGYASSIWLIWPSGNNEVARAEITVSGRLWSLQEIGAPAASPLKNGLGRSTLLNGYLPVYYYPFEESGSATYTTDYASGLRLTPSGAVNWGSSSALTASAPLPTIPTGTSIIIGIGTSLAASWRFDFVFSIPTVVATQTTVIQWTMFGGATAPRWRLVATPGTPPVMKLQAVTGAGVELFGDTGIALRDLHGTPIPTGAPIFCTVEASTNGVSVDWGHSYAYGGGGVGSQGNKSPYTLGVTQRAIIAPDAVMDGMVFGHFAYIQPSDWNGSTFRFADEQYLQSYAGESATARLTRLCSEYGIPFTQTGTSQQAMGPQTQDSVFNLLRSCEDVDGGILCDGRTAGVTYLSMTARQNAGVVLALDVTAHQVKWHGESSFEPIEDDQRTADDVTVSRPGGTSERAIAFVDRRLSGRHQKSLTKQVATDEQLPSQATWRLALGRVPEMRTPTIELDLRDRPELLSQWLRMDIGSRYTVANPPSQYPAGGLDLVLESYTETFAGDSHTVRLTGFPFAPFRSQTVEDPILGRVAGAGGSFVAHVGTGDVLAVGISATDTSVTLAGATWVDSATYPADFPFDVDIEGEQCRVTASSGAPSTFTITRSINGVFKAHATGVLLKLWRPAGIGL